MTQSFAQDHKRLGRRHHRVDAELQARARPFSLVRKDPAKVIREFVENHAEGGHLERRIGGIFSGGGGDDGDSSPGTGGNSNNGSQRGSGDGGSSRGGGNGSVGGGSTTGGSGTGTGSGNDSGNRSGSGTGSDEGTGTGSNDENNNSSSSSSSSSSASNKTKGIIESLESKLHHSSTTSSSSSSSTSSSTRTTSSSTPTSTSTSSSSSTPMTPSTSVAYVTPTAAIPTLNNAAANASASPSGTSSNGPGAGLIIGIVAGALAGIAVLVALVGFLIKKFAKKDDPYQNNPFDSGDFRRQSAMLPDTFDDIDHNPEMSEINHHNNMSPFNDEMEYAAAGAAGAGVGSAFIARNESGGPRPPTMFQNHMNAPAAQLGPGGDAPPVPMIGSVFNPNGVDPSPQLPPMTFGGSDPYSMAGVGRSNFDNNLNNPYGYLDRQYSTSRSSPQDKFVDAPQGYADLARTGSDGSTQGKNAGQMYSVPESNDFRSYDYHDTAGRPGTAEGRSGTPDLPNVQQTYAMADNRESEGRAQSPNRQILAPSPHLNQDFLSNGSMQPYQQHSQQQQYNQDQLDHYQDPDTPSPPSQPLQVRNLLPNSHLAVHQNNGQRPVSGASSMVDDEAAYGGVW